MGAVDPRTVFDSVAAQYAVCRPSYPQAIAERLVETAGLRDGSRILEIGAGPGTATALFARRGFRITALEPGPHLVAIARARFADDPGVEVLVTTFEEWPLDASAFSLVFAAQAFHWIDPSVAFVKAADALASGGVLAVIANRPVIVDSALERDVQAAYAVHAPSLAHDAALRNSLDTWGPLFAQSGRFEPARALEVPWSGTYSADEYVALLGTYSPHLGLEATVRARLLADIRAAIERHGGRRPVAQVAICCYAKLSERPRAALAGSRSRPTPE